MHPELHASKHLCRIREYGKLSRAWRCIYFAGNYTFICKGRTLSHLQDDFRECLGIYGQHSVSGIAKLSFHLPGVWLALFADGEHLTWWCDCHHAMESTCNIFANIDYPERSDGRPDKCHHIKALRYKPWNHGLSYHQGCHTCVYGAPLGR